MKEKLKEAAIIIVKLIAVFAGILLLLVVAGGVMAIWGLHDAQVNREARIAAQYQTPMDEQYVGLRWKSNEWRKIEVMYFDIVEEGEPPRGVCVFDGVAYDVMLVGPFGAEGMDSRDYYVVPADTEITDEVPEEYMFYGHLHWEVGKKEFYYSFDSQNEDYVSTLEFHSIKIPVDALHGA